MPNISEILTLPEGRTLEFKQDLSSLKPIMKSLIAFANTAGGTLIIGKRDDGEIIGVSDVLKAEEQLANAIADHISPRLMPEIEIASYDQVSLLVVRVSHWRGPFFLKSQGEEEGVYIRLGSTNRLAGPEMLNELKRAINNVSFDELACPACDKASLDMKKIEVEFAKVGKKVTNKTLETLKILVPYNGKLVCSNAGILLFGKSDVRREYFSNSEVRCARFQGESRKDFIDQLDIEGSVLDALAEVPKFIKRNTQVASSIEGVKRVDIPEYSPVIIREILTNALAHADYSIQGMHPRVAIFSNRMEIESPGMFPYGYTLENFFTGVSHVRNKVIARILRELNFMEEWGTGYQRICETCEKENYPKPIWEEVGATIRVCLPSKSTIKPSAGLMQAKASHDLSLRQQEILSMLQGDEPLSTKVIGEKLKTSVAGRTLRKDLQFLLAKGYILMLGKGRSTTWKAVDI